MSRGYLGLYYDEERSETRYVLRIAEFSESSKFRTQYATMGYSCSYASLTCEKPITFVRLIPSFGKEFLIRYRKPCMESMPSMQLLEPGRGLTSVLNRKQLAWVIEVD